MSKIFVDQVDPKTATTLTLGTSGDTVDIPTGVGLSVTDEVKTNKISPATGTAFALGDSGDTFTVPSGATIVNSGTATGFGGGKMGQLLQQVYATEVTASVDSGDGADSGLSLAITPAATGSKILVEANIANSFYTGSATGYGIKIYRTISGGSASSVFDNNYHWVGVGYIYVSSGTPSGRLHTFWNYLDSPSTTLATTYNIRVYTESAGAIKFQPDTEQSTLTLTEVLA